MEVIQTPIGEKIFSQYYHRDGNTNIIVVGRGAPSIRGTCIESETLLHNGYDIVIPEYIGSWRSDGCFTPMGCIESIRIVCDHAHRLYDQVSYVGMSFGGVRSQYIDVDNVFLLAPVLDPLLYGKDIYRESDIDEFCKRMQTSYYNIYRGFEPKERISFFVGHKQTHRLPSSTVILHGQDDDSISYHRSVHYAQQHDIQCVVYPNIGHQTNILREKLVSGFLIS